MTGAYKLGEASNPWMLNGTLPQTPFYCLYTYVQTLDGCINIVRKLLMIWFAECSVTQLNYRSLNENSFVQIPYKDLLCKWVTLLLGQVFI